MREELKRVRASSRASEPAESIEVFARAGAHAGDDVGRLRHFAVGEDGNLQGRGANQFDGVDGALRIVRGNVDDDDFGARILKLAQNRVGGADGKSRRD